jgi:NADPH2:quinone reductase
MYAHKITDFTGPDGVLWSQVDEPSSGDGDVLVDVVAAGVSFADLLQTRGQYQMKVPVPYVPGMDAAGVVRSAPAGSGLAAGQRAAVFVPDGCWAEVVSATVSRVLPLPDGMGFEAGAASCLNYLTVLFALVRRGRAVAGETLLVHGAAGGVGIAAIGLGRALGLRTIAVAGDEAKRDFALRCGADHAVLAEGWLAAVRGLLGERSVDIVLDPVGSSPGNDRMTDSLRSLAPEGRVLVLGFAGGEIPVVKVNRLLLGNTGVLGVAVREFLEGRPELVRPLWEQLMGLELRDVPVVAFPFADARGALRLIADRKARGKVVLSRQVSEPPVLG